MPALSVRLTDPEAKTLDTIARRRRIKGRGARSEVIRRLLAEEHERLNAGKKPPKVAPRDELKELLTAQARKGSVAAMKELRAMIDEDAKREREESERAAGSAAAPADGDAPPGKDEKVTPIDAIRNRRR